LYLLIIVFVNGDGDQVLTPSIVLACNGCVLQIADDFKKSTLKNILDVVKEL